MIRTAAALVALLALAACSPGEAPRPNLVLVLADTLRADFLGCYGFDGPSSPQFDRLAQESVRFEACHSQAPWTKPSIASLFTGLYPQTHGVLTHDGLFAERGGAAVKELETDVLPQAANTLAERLAEGGYRTQAFVTNPWIRREHGFDQGFAGFEQSLPVERSTEEVMGDAADWALAQASDRPFFLYVHVMEVHGPYDSPEADAQALAEAPGLGASRSLSARDQRRLPEYLRAAAWARGMGAGDLRTWRQRYAAGVHAFDRHLGTFVERLRAAGTLERSWLVVTSDHGEELLEHGGWDHGSSLHDHQLHVPLVMRAPGAARAGRVVGAPLELIDLAPTLLSLAGLSALFDGQGRDRSAWLGAAGGTDAVAPEGAALGTGVKWKPELVSLRTATHRLILGGAAPRLFDLRADPYEQQDLSASEPERVRALSAQLLERLEEVERTPPLVGERAAVSGDLRAQLSDLGYY